MKRRSFAGRGLTILWVFATAQVMGFPSDGESAEVYKAISDHKEGIVTQMITNKGLQKASRQLNMSPLRAADINPNTDDNDSGDDDGDDLIAAEKQPQQQQPEHLRPLEPSAPAVDNIETGTAGDVSEADMSQAKDDQLILGDDETKTTENDEKPFASDGYGVQQFESNPQHSRYPQHSGYPQHSSYPQYSGYPQHSRYPQYSGYPHHSSYPQYSSYPQHSSYPQYSSYPQQSSYLQHSRYPQQSNYPQHSTPIFESPRVRRVKSETEGLEDSLPTFFQRSGVQA